MSEIKSSYTDDDIGHQSNEASQDAAYFNVEGKITLREQVLQLFKINKRLTNEQVASILNRAEVSTQPRVSELKNAGAIRNSGIKSVGKWGTSITVWELVE